MTKDLASDSDSMLWKFSKAIGLTDEEIKDDALKEEVIAFGKGQLNNPKVKEYIFTKT